MLKKLGKKGNMTDPIFLAVILFATFVSLIIIVVVWSRMQPALFNAINHSNSDEDTVEMIGGMHTKITAGLNFYDYLAPTYLIGVITMMIISAFFIKSHPIFFFISLFLLLVFIIVGVVLSNTYQSIMESESMVDTASEFEVTNMIMKYLPVIMIFSFFIAAIFLFTKSGEPPGGPI
jgi:hypothetical protein